MNKYAIGDNLLRLARDRHMTEKYIAGQIGVHTNTITRWVQGNTIPNAYDLYRMARILGTSMDELMKGVES